MFSECKNTKQQGNIGLGQAIAYFTRLGYIVSLPLNDSQDYDLVVDNGESLSRVQVKTTSAKTPYGVYYVDTRSTGGNQSRYINKYLDKSKVDAFFVMVENGNCYYIPIAAITAKACINLGKNFEEFKLGTNLYGAL